MKPNKLRSASLTYSFELDQSQEPESTWILDMVFSNVASFQVSESEDTQSPPDFEYGESLYASTLQQENATAEIVRLVHLVKVWCRLLARIMHNLSSSHDLFNFPLESVSMRFRPDQREYQLDLAFIRGEIPRDSNEPKGGRWSFISYPFFDQRIVEGIFGNRRLEGATDIIGSLNRLRDELQDLK